MKKILLVDDEESILELLTYNLTNRGYQILTAINGFQGLELARKEHPALIILDLMLPGMDGFEVCRHLRETTKVPILMLTARREETDKVLGLELGADDYLTKPFSPRELVARVKALIRRSETYGGLGSDRKGKEISIGDLVINPEQHGVTKDGRPLALTSKEFALLNLLASHPGRVFTREYLMDTLWGENYFGDPRTIDVHIRHLREKIENNPGCPRHLVTVRGAGYKFKEQNDV